MEKLGAPALLLSGEGTLTAQNGLGLFAYEQYRTACLTLRGGTLRIPAGLEDGLYMGNASGADDLLLLEDGTLISGSGAWLDHAAAAHQRRHTDSSERPRECGHGKRLTDSKRWRDQINLLQEYNPRTPDSRCAVIQLVKKVPKDFF